VPTEKLEENVFFQVQRMFAHLAFSHARSFTPDGIWRSMKDLEGQPINVLVRSQNVYFESILDEKLSLQGASAPPKHLHWECTMRHAQFYNVDLSCRSIRMLTSSCISCTR
jgi:hypothetical protein